MREGWIESDAAHFADCAETPDAENGPDLNFIRPELGNAAGGHFAEEGGFLFDGLKILFILGQGLLTGFLGGFYPMMFTLETHILFILFWFVEHRHTLPYSTMVCCENWLVVLSVNYNLADEGCLWSMVSTNGPIRSYVCV